MVKIKGPKVSRKVNQDLVDQFTRLRARGESASSPDGRSTAGSVVAGGGTVDVPSERAYGAYDPNASSEDRRCACGVLLRAWEQCWCPAARALVGAVVIGPGVDGRGYAVDTGFHLDGSPVDYDGDAGISDPVIASAVRLFGGHPVYGVSREQGPVQGAAAPRPVDPQPADDGLVLF